MKEQIKVMVVDDSIFMQKALSRMLNSDPGLKVVGTAGSGEEALEMARDLRPDVVTLDVKMAGLDGLEVLDLLMKELPCRVVMVSAFTTRRAQVTMEALERGAIDFVSKPSAFTVMDIVKLEDELVGKVKNAALVDLKQFKKERSAGSLKITSKNTGELNLVAIGCSTGGPRALEAILAPIPEEFPASIVIVQHMPPGFTSALAVRLDKKCRITVKEAEEGERLEPGRAYIAPTGFQIGFISRKGGVYLELTAHPVDTPHIPSIDVMMASAARVFKEKCLGILLTGMGRDGAKGLMEIRKSGGLTLAEDESTCIVFGMPQAALRSGAADKAVPLYEIAGNIIDAVCRVRVLTGKEKEAGR